MRIGDLRHRIELQKPTETSDGMGGFTTTYNEQYVVSAAIWPISSKEQIQAETRNNEITHRIRIRYKSDVKANWRIKFGDRYFSIAGPPINPNEQNKMLEMLCKEVEAA